MIAVSSRVTVVSQTWIRVSTNSRITSVGNDRSKTTAAINVPVRVIQSQIVTKLVGKRVHVKR